MTSDAQRCAGKRLLFAFLFFSLASLVLSAAPARAAKFVLSVPQPAVKVGEETNAYIELAPMKGEKVMGGRLTLTVNPQYILLSPDQNKYASDGAFSKVEKFKADPISGTIVFNVQTDAPITKTKIFLRVPIKFVQAGISSISYSSSVYFEDIQPVAANAGYQRVAGVTGAVDPLLYSSLVGENGTLRESSVSKELEIAKPLTAAGAGTGEIDMTGMDIGVALAETNSDADADVVLEFSRRTISVGLRQWVRLDVMVTKFPASESVTGVAFKVRYDPQALQFTDSVGQPASTVALNNVFKLGFANEVDAAHGVINLGLGVDLQVQSTPVPVNVVSLYFRTMRETGDTRVTFDDVLLPVSNPDAKMSKHDAAISASSRESKCDSALPATLCKGTFKVTGDLTMSLANKNETLRDPLGGQAGSAQVMVKKYYLDQTWNMHMDGSFKNGIRLQGALTDSPNSPQSVNIEMLGDAWKANFGNFTTSFAESKFVSFNSNELTGLLLNYKYKNLSFRMLSAERKSTPMQTTITGADKIGPYQVPFGIIPSSLRIYRDNAQISADDYTYDIIRNELTFKKSVTVKETIVVAYQQTSTALFSTGNIQAYRTDYAPKDGSFNIGSTYLSTMSPKSGSQVRLFSSENIDSNTTATGTVAIVEDCAFFASKKCISIKVAHPYLIKGTISITSKTGAISMTYSENHIAQVFVGHRGYYEGRIYLEYNAFNPLNISVEYSYYNPQFLSQPSIVSYNIENKNSTYDSQSWPVDMFPGSEMIYLSNDNASDITEGVDQIVCYLSESAADKDVANICPGTYSPVEQSKSYYLKEQNSTTYVKISDISLSKRLKVKYSTVPPDLPTASEFQKTAWNVDTKFKIGKKIDVNGEYAMANSDLSASFNTITEQVVVDVNTFSDTSMGDAAFKYNTCWWQPGSFVYGGQAAGILQCKLKGSKLQGAIQIQIQKCDLTSATSTECAKDADGSYIYSANSGRIFDVLIPLNSIERDKGIIKMLETADGWKTDAPYNLTSSGFNREPKGFPIQGDKLYVTYTYDQALSRVVTGGAYYVSAAFRNKSATVSVERRALSPLFDKSLSTFKDTSYTKFDLSLSTFKRWAITFNQSESLNETADAKKVVTSSTFTPSKAYSLRYIPKMPTQCRSAPCAPDKSLQITTLSFSRNDMGSRMTTGSTLSESLKKTLTGMLALSFRNNKYMATLSRSNDNTIQKAGTQPSSRSRINNLGFNWKPSSKYQFTYNFSRTIGSPTGNVSDSRDYKISLKPLTLFSLDVGFQRNNSKTTSVSEPTVQQRMNYTLTFPKIRKINMLGITFNRDQTPGNTIQNPFRTRNDNLVTGFSINLKKNLVLRPSYTRTVGLTQPSSWSLSRIRNWSLDYNRRIRKKGSLVTTLSKASSNSLSGIGGTITTTTKSQSLDTKYYPSPKTSITTSFKRGGGSGAPTRSVIVTYSKSLWRELSFTAGMDISRAFSITPTKRISKNMAFTWALNQDTSFTLNYSRTDDRAFVAAGQPRSNTTFSTVLHTNLR